MSRRIYLLLFLVVLFVGSNGQSEHKCKPGYRCIPFMRTTSLIVLGGCYPDSVAMEMEIAISKSVCLETQWGFGGKTYKFDERHTWDDSIGCVSKKTWQIYRNNKWIKVTEKVFDSTMHVDGGWTWEDDYKIRQ